MTERKDYGAVDRLSFGLDAGRAKSDTEVHPAQVAMARANKLAVGRKGEWLCQVQGVHAPLRLQAELRAAERVQRLPFLQSSNLQLDTLTGRDDTLDFCDFLGGVEGSEVMGQPHAMVERKLGLL